MTGSRPATKTRCPAPSVLCDVVHAFGQPTSGSAVADTGSRRSAGLGDDLACSSGPLHRACFRLSRALWLLAPNTDGATPVRRADAAPELAAEAEARAAGDRRAHRRRRHHRSRRQGPGFRRAGPPVIAAAPSAHLGLGTAARVRGVCPCAAAASTPALHRSVIPIRLSFVTCTSDVNPGLHYSACLARRRILCGCDV